MIDLDWELLDRYLARGCTVAEREQVDRWLAASPANRQALLDLQAGLLLAGERAEPQREAAILASLQQEWGVSDSPSATRRISAPLQLVPPRQAASWWLTVSKVAAVAVLLAGTGLLAGRMISGSKASSIQAGRASGLAVSTARGERRTLTLSDGTTVVLAPASTLRWSAAYGAKDRVVELDGEAAFTVTHDTARPFAVRTPHALARDLGTRFIVRAYPGDTATNVIVAEGVVAVMPALGAVQHRDSTVLYRGDHATVATARAVEVTHNVPLDDAFAWTLGRLVLSDVPFRDAAAQLSRWYDIEIQYDGKALDTRMLSVSFEDEPGSEAMRVIASILSVHVSRAGRVYTLQPK